MTPAPSRSFRSDRSLGRETPRLLPACVDAVAPVPVIAAGGVADGAAVARALNAGAQGVSLGTVFLAAEEADVHPEYR